MVRWTPVTLTAFVRRSLLLLIDYSRTSHIRVFVVVTLDKLAIEGVATSVPDLVVKPTFITYRGRATIVV